MSPTNQRRDCPDCGDPLGLKAVSCRCGWGAKKAAGLTAEAAQAREADYLARRAASIERAGESRKSGSPLVREIREAYLKSPAYRLGLKSDIGAHVDAALREPGQDDEELAA